jgi:hypothetical protein
MKQTSIILIAVVCAMLTSCGAVGIGTAANSSESTQTQQAAANNSDMLGNVLSAVAGGSGLGNVLQSVLGLDKVTKQNIVGTWSYSQPGCAFTSKELLAQAGGEVVASSIKEKLQPSFQKVGIKSSNTSITFNQDGTFAAKIAGKSWSGTYTFDEATYKITLQGLLLNVNCYAKKNSDGIGLLFEASKLLTILQTMTALSGNATAKTIGDIAGSYDGLRVGFDFK